MAVPTMANNTPKHKIFQDESAPRLLELPWERTIQMCWANIQRRVGRFMLVFIGIAVVVAFLTSNIAYQSMLGSFKEYAARSETAEFQELRNQSVPASDIIAKREAMDKAQRDADDALKKAEKEANDAKSKANSASKRADRLKTEAAIEESKLATEESQKKATALEDAQKVSRNTKPAPPLTEEEKKILDVDRKVKDIVHVQSELERIGVYSDSLSEKKQRDQQIWLMVLSSMLCLVGITNTMLMSVTERIREIGTLKCLGALDRFIVRLFMIESIFIGIVGSLIGAILGYILMLIQVGLVLEFRMILFGNYLELLFKGVSLAVISGTVLTVLAAIYPTYVAARMKPVDAMRVEV